MKDKKKFWIAFSLINLIILLFWAFAHFITESKPINVPLYGKIDFNNSLLLLPIIIINYLLLAEKCLSKKINFKLIFFFGFSLIILINMLKTNLPFYQSLNHPNDYYADSLQIKNLKKFLSSFDRRIFYHRLHTRTHPPGPVIFHFILHKIFPNQIVLNSLIVIILSTLTSLFIYKIAHFFKIKEKNILLLLFFSSPGILIYSATCMDAVFAFLITISIYFLLLLTKKCSLKNIVFASFWIFLAGFFTYAAIIIPFFSIFFIIFNKFKNKKYILSQILILIINLFLYFILKSTTGFEPIKTFFAAKNFNTMLMPDIFMTFKRYFYSVSANFIEYFIFLGLPIFGLLVLNIINLFKKKGKIQFFNYYLSILLPIILLNITGIYKTGQYSGETGRIWLFLTPLIIAGLKFKEKKILKTAAYLSFIQALIIQLSLDTFW